MEWSWNGVCFYTSNIKGKKIAKNEILELIPNKAVQWKLDSCHTIKVLGEFREKWAVFCWPREKCCRLWCHSLVKWKNIEKSLTANAFSDSLCIQIIPWSDVALHDSTICSNLPSTGMAVLTSGGNLPHLSRNKTWLRKSNEASMSQYWQIDLNAGVNQL